MITISIFDQTATIENYHWTSTDKDIEKMLNSMLDPMGTSPSQPYPDMDSAQDVVQRLGAKIIKADPPPTYDPNTIY